MSFVDELFSEADQKRVGELPLEELFTRQGHAYKWIVDRDRDIYLIEGQVDRDCPQFVPFLFGWKGLQINVVVERHGTGDRVAGFDWSWRRASDFTTGTRARRQPIELPMEAVSDLKDAFTAYSNRINPARDVQFTDF